MVRRAMSALALTFLAGCSGDREVAAPAPEPVGSVAQALCNPNLECPEFPCMIGQCVCPNAGPNCQSPDVCACVCQYTPKPDGSFCAQGPTACYNPNFCITGQCAGTSPKNAGDDCNDGDGCTEMDKCDANQMCKGTPRTCDAGEVCVGGECKKLAL